MLYRALPFQFGAAHEHAALLFNKRKHDDAADDELSHRVWR
jgi:hypothetical protein